MLKIVIFVFAFLYISVINASVTEEDVQNAKKVLARISQIDKQCTVTSDCAAIPIGRRSCGGATDYIVYSKMSVYANYIEELAPLTSKLEEQYNKENSVVSSCSIVLEPTLVCGNNRCTRGSFLYAIAYPIGRS